MIQLRRRRRQQTVSRIERIVSKVADEYGYGNVWLFGNYYVGLYSEGCPVQMMLDSSENPQHPLGFVGACRRETGLDVVVYLSVTDPKTITISGKKASIVLRTTHPQYRNQTYPILSEPVLAVCGPFYE